MERNGKLVIIGPDDGDDGSLDPAAPFSCTANLFIAWARRGEAIKTLYRVQSESVQPLTVYGLMRATRGEVAELKRNLASHRIRGGWFAACDGLTAVVRILQGNTLVDEPNTIIGT